MNTSAHMSLWQRFRQWAAQPWLFWAYNQGCQDERRRQHSGEMPPVPATSLAWGRQLLQMTPISVPAVQKSTYTPGALTRAYHRAHSEDAQATKKTRMTPEERRDALRNVFSDIETIPAPQDIDPALVTIGDIPLSEPAQHNPLALTGLAADLFGTENDAWLSSTEREPTHALDELADLATMRHNSDTLEVPTYMRKKRAKSEESE